MHELFLSFFNFNFHSFHSFSAEAVVGMFLTMAGITLCVMSSIDKQDAAQPAH